MEVGSWKLNRESGVGRWKLYASAIVCFRLFSCQEVVSPRRCAIQYPLTVFKSQLTPTLSQRHIRDAGSTCIMSQNAVVLHFPVPRTKKRSNYDRFRATMEREWLSKLPQPFKVFENNHFFPRVRQFRFPPAEVPRKVLLYFSYDLQRASHQFAPGIDVACANVIQKEVLNNVFMKHEMSQNESLKPFVQDGVDLEKFGPDSPDKITTLAKKHSALIAKPSWGKAGTGILTSSDPQAIIDHIRTLKDRYAFCPLLTTPLHVLAEVGLDFVVCRYFEWRVERYIDNPLLFEGKKFHIGVYILLVRHISWKECKVYLVDVLSCFLGTSFDS